MAAITDVGNRSIKFNTVVPIKIVQEELITKAVEVIKEISADNVNRMENYPKDLSLLNSGIFYGNEYYKILKATNQIPRLNYFKNSGSFYHGYASTQHFFMVPDAKAPSKVIGSLQVLKKEVEASSALKALREKLSFLGCGECCQLAGLEAIKHIWGEKKFNVLFAADSPTPLKIKFDCMENAFLNLIVFEQDKNISLETIFKGDIVFFKNTPLYSWKHVNGEAAGYVTICCDDTPGNKKFTTLGLKPEGMTYLEIKEQFLKELNDDPIGMEILSKEVTERLAAKITSESLEKIQSFANTKWTMEEFEKNQGGLIFSKLKFNIRRIAQIKNSSIEEARKLFSKWMLASRI